MWVTISPQEREPLINTLSRNDSVGDKARPHPPSRGRYGGTRPGPMGCLPKAATIQAPSKRRSLREMWSQARHQCDAHQETNAPRFVVLQRRRWGKTREGEDIS